MAAASENDEGSCCIPAGFGKIKFRRKHGPPKAVHVLAAAEESTRFRRKPGLQFVDRVLSIRV
jgi:hypothetical protein